MVDSASGIWRIRLAFLFTAADVMLEPTKMWATGQSLAIKNAVALCKTNVSGILPPPYSDLRSSTCSPVWNGFAFRFFQSKDNVTTIVISSTYSSKWIGIAFPRKPPTITDAGAIVGWIARDGKSGTRKYYIDSQNHSHVTPTEANYLELTNVPPVVLLHNTSIYLGFQLQSTIHPGHQTVLLAEGSGNPDGDSLPMHVAAETLTIEFLSAAGPPNNRGDYSMLKMNHGILGITAYGLILPVGAIVARYFKHYDPLWYHLHYVIQYVGYIFGIAALALGRQLFEQMGHPLPQHRILGITVIVLSTLQVLAFVLRPHKDSQFQRYYHCYHSWVGRCVLLCGIGNIILGIEGGNAPTVMKIACYLLLASTFVALIVVEVRSRARVSGDVDKHRILEADSQQVWPT